MKRFRFPLGHVLELRRRQLEREEAALDALHAERRALETEIAAFEAEAGEARREAAGAASREGGDLAALGRYLAAAARVRARLAARLAGCDGRIEEQRKVAVEARRRVRLLEHLESARRDQWRRAFDREMEASAQELFLARWGARRRGGRKPDA